MDPSTLRTHTPKCPATGGILADGIAEPLSSGPSAFSSVGVARGSIGDLVLGRQEQTRTTGRKRGGSTGSKPPCPRHVVPHVAPHSSRGLLSAPSGPGFLPAHRDVLQVAQRSVVRDEGCANQDALARTEDQIAAPREVSVFGVVRSQLKPRLGFGRHFIVRAMSE